MKHLNAKRLERKREREALASTMKPIFHWIFWTWHFCCCCLFLLFTAFTECFLYILFQLLTLEFTELSQYIHVCCIGQLQFLAKVYKYQNRIFQRWFLILKPIYRVRDFEWIHVFRFPWNQMIVNFFTLLLILFLLLLSLLCGIITIIATADAAATGSKQDVSDL